jgi:hypothetical protein
MGAQIEGMVLYLSQRCENKQGAAAGFYYRTIRTIWELYKGGDGRLETDLDGAYASRYGSTFVYAR